MPFWAPHKGIGTAKAVGGTQDEHHILFDQLQPHVFLRCSTRTRICASNRNTTSTIDRGLLSIDLSMLRLGIQSSFALVRDVYEIFQIMVEAGLGGKR